MESVLTPSRTPGSILSGLPGTTYREDALIVARYAKEHEEKRLEEKKCGKKGKSVKSKKKRRGHHDEDEEEVADDDLLLGGNADTANMGEDSLRFGGCMVSGTAAGCYVPPHPVISEEHVLRILDKFDQVVTAGEKGKALISEEMPKQTAARPAAGGATSSSRKRPRSTSGSGRR